MPRTKFLEIRDRNTFVPMVAIDCSIGTCTEQNYLLRSAGYGAEFRCILLTRLDGGHSHYDCYDWGDRTFKVAHHWIAKNWDRLADGDVVDVEFILGERPAPKISQRLEPLD